MEISKELFDKTIQTIEIAIDDMEVRKELFQGEYWYISTLNRLATIRAELLATAIA